jgi:hypothetical protein
MYALLAIKRAFNKRMSFVIWFAYIVCLLCTTGVSIAAVVRVWRKQQAPLEPAVGPDDAGDVAPSPPTGTGADDSAGHDEPVDAKKTDLADDKSKERKTDAPTPTTPPLLPEKIPDTAPGTP